MSAAGNLGPCPGDQGAGRQPCPSFRTAGEVAAALLPVPSATAARKTGAVRHSAVPPRAYTLHGPLLQPTTRHPPASRTSRPHAADTSAMLFRTLSVPGSDRTPGTRRSHAPIARRAGPPSTTAAAHRRLGRPMRQVPFLALWGPASETGSHILLSDHASQGRATLLPSRPVSVARLLPRDRPPSAALPGCPAVADVDGIGGGRRR